MPYIRNKNTGETRWVDDTPASGNGEPVFTPLPKNPYDVEKDRREEGRASRGEGRDERRVDLSARGDARDSDKQVYDFATRLRNDYDASAPVKAYQTIIRQYANGLSAAKTAAGDQALINSYSQMLNPTSTVMLGEYQAAEQNDTTLARIRERLKREFGWDGSGRISDAARAQLLDEMHGLTVNANNSYKQERERYRALAQNYQIAPELVVGEHAGQPFYKMIEQARTPRGIVESLDENGNVIASTDDEGLTGSVTDDGGPKDPGVIPPDDYRNSYVGQGMSGINEGIASTLGAPVDLMTLGMNLGVKGFNAATNSSIPEISKPFLGSDYLKGQMEGWGIYGGVDDPSKQFTRRVGQSVGAAYVPMAGTAGAWAQAPKILGVAGAGGAGAATAQQMFPNNPAAEFGGELLGSGLGAGALATANRFAATRRAIEQVPSRETLRDQASNLYNAAESRGIVAGPNVTSNLSGRFNQIADDAALRWPNGKVDPNYPRAGAALDMMGAHAGQSIDPRQIQVLRDNLTDSVRATQGKERRISQQLLDAFDDETIPLAPELAQARNVSSRYLQSDEINRARDLAEARASQYSNGGMENALRTDFRALDKAIVKGKANFNPAAQAAVQKVARGSKYSNAMRGLGKLAPTGVVSGGISAGVPFAIGNAIGGPGVGAAASAGTMSVGVLARKAAEQAAIRDAKMADVLARNGGPLKLPPRLSPEQMKLLAHAGLGLGSQYIPRKKR